MRVLGGALGRLVLENLTDRWYAVPGQWNIRRCTNPKCSLFWIDPQLDQTDLVRLYPGYFTHGVPLYMSKSAVDQSLKCSIHDGVVARALAMGEHRCDQLVLLVVRVFRMLGRLATISKSVRLQAGACIMWLGGVSFCGPQRGQHRVLLFLVSWKDWDPPRHLFLFSVRILSHCLCEAGFVTNTVGTLLNRMIAVWAQSCAIQRTCRTGSRFPARFNPCDHQTVRLVGPIRWLGE